MIDDVKIKIVRSDGKELLIGSSQSDWLIPSEGLDGIDYPSTNLYTEANAIGNGSYVTGKNVESRTIKISAKVKNSVLNNILRANAVHFFNNRYTFKLYITYGGVTRWIDTNIDGFKCPSGNIYYPVTLTVSFYAAEPFLKSVEEFGKDIAGIIPTWGFPWIDTVDIAPKPDVFQFAKQVFLENDGDTEAYIYAVMRFKDTVTNPKITCNGSYIRILGTFNSNDVITIDVERRKVYNNAVNIITKLDKLSSFSDTKINIGGSIIVYSADSGDVNMSATIYYNKLYGGM